MTLDGLNYKSDTRKVHQLIHGFVHGETAETWVNPKERKQDVRLDYLALLAHYGGKGNKAVWVKYSEVLQKLIIYKNERAMSFKTFLTNIQTMFTRFSENEEIFNDSQKIQIIFQKVQSHILTQIKASLQVSYDIKKSNSATYDIIYNRL